MLLVDAMHKWIESRIFELKALGKQKTKRGLADALGLPDSRVPAIIAGTRKLSFKDVMGIAAYLELSFIDVAENFGVYPGAFGRGVVPVVGYVGAGSEVFPIDDHAQGDGLELVPLCIKELRSGSTQGLFTLLSWNAEPIIDVGLVWATRILDIRPT